MIHRLFDVVVTCILSKSITFIYWVAFATALANYLTFKRIYG